MTFAGLLAVGGGAAIRAWLRRGLGRLLNPIFRTASLGAIAAKTLGGLLLGFAVTSCSYYQALPPEVRLLVPMRFLRGLTTFSTLLAETATLLREQFRWAALTDVAHLQCSILMTLAGTRIMRVFLT